ncbi:DUF1190 domain-containing protein [Arsukibacterium sp.]|uniref:DUF1190 domain-containing protein n=1 Tax=Arsukibacterium sp. TaxID=1977258 RepID=UPI00299E8B17|nr:DUF1190 domain-containing protein [Arsukibacterium sp.]MDX1537127.1 DUF1190 domain-containing protein [Arsukibacterium sp.]
MTLRQTKRSQKAALIFMLPATGLALNGCAEKQVEAQVFSTPEECAAFYNPPAQCQAAFAEAAQLHPKVAPRYANKQECEADFGAGQCETAPEQHQQGSFFMPMMMGFMAGQMLNRGGLAPAAGQTGQQTAAATGRNTVPTQPLYKSRDDRNTFRTATNTAVASQPGSTSIRPSAVQPKPATLARRGGFGAQAAQRSANRSYGG